MRCGQCGNDTQPGSGFCGVCGADLRTAASPYGPVAGAPASGPSPAVWVALALMALAVVFLVVYLATSRSGDDAADASTGGSTASAAGQTGQAGASAPAVTVTASAPAAAGQPTTPAAGGQAQAQSGPVPESGTYTGAGYQRGLNGTRADKSYAVEMTFSGSGSTVRYPDLGCAGVLRPIGFDGGRRVYREEMTTGRCDNSGTWQVSVVSGTQVSGSYSPPSGRYVVTAELSR